LLYAHIRIDQPVLGMVLDLRRFDDKYFPKPSLLPAVIHEVLGRQPDAKYI
jgi:hypothetical protein